MLKLLFVMVLLVVNFESSVSSSVCDLPLDSGPCRSAIRKYGYNSDLGVCEEFFYGGCRGNDNRFDTIDQCRDACTKE